MITVLLIAIIMFTPRTIGDFPTVFLLVFAFAFSLLVDISIIGAISRVATAISDIATTYKTIHDYNVTALVKRDTSSKSSH